jgi:hypothetical protein
LKIGIVISRFFKLLPDQFCKTNMLCIKSNRMETDKNEVEQIDEVLDKVGAESIFQYSVFG